MPNIYLLVVTDLSVCLQLLALGLQVDSATNTGGMKMKIRQEDYDTLKALCTPFADKLQSHKIYLESGQGGKVFDIDTRLASDLAFWFSLWFGGKLRWLT